MRTEFRPATTADAPALMDLRIEAETWLAAAGIDQWRTSDGGIRDRALAKWRSDIDAGRTWVVTDTSTPVATITLAPADPDFWGPDDDPADAVYVAKLITSRQVSGHNLGGRLLDWAGSEARTQGRTWVRLDCWRSNKALHAYYLREGFAHLRTESPSHRLSGWLAQRPAYAVMHPEALLTRTLCCTKP